MEDNKEIKNENIEMDIDVLGLPDTTNQNTKTVLEYLWESTTIGSGIDIILDQVGTVALNTLSNEIYVQLDACGWNPSGNTTTFAQDDILLKVLKTDEEICAKTMRSKYFSQIYKLGVDSKSLPIENFITEGKSKLLAQTVETLMWQGDVASGVGNLNKVDGLAAFLEDKTSTYIAASSASGSTTDVNNVIDRVDKLIAGRPVEMLNLTDQAVYVDPIVYNTYIRALKTSGLYQGTAMELKPWGATLMIDGYNIEMISTGGLSNTGFMYLLPKSNMVFATDTVSSTSSVKVTYYERGENFDVKSRWSQGTGVYFPHLIVHNNENITQA